MARKKYVQVENKNALLELLNDGKEFERVYLANNAYKDIKTKQIVAIASNKGIPVEKVARKSISRRSKTASKESVIGLMEIDNMYSLKELLAELHSEQKQPFFLIFNDVKYPQNIGAIFRTAYACGVNGVITPIQKGNLITDEVVRISMGACLRIPIVEMNLFGVVKELQQNAIVVAGVDMDGEAMYDSDLTGPIALMMGSEDVGISSKLDERLDKRVSIPMREGIGSLNVGVATGVVLYEKVRQEYDLIKKGISPLKKS